MYYWISSAIFALLLNWVDGHGRLFDPPSRSTAWRVGFNTPKDYNDMEGFCGGFERQWIVNKGKCGVCGDPYDEPVKPHQAPGGIFATGTIVRTYKQGEIIPVTIQITATHKGYYEFKLCPNNNPAKDPEQDCFDKIPPLKLVGGSEGGSTKFSLENVAAATYQLRLQLPPDVTCTQCIFQWTYVTGNRWGVCPDGTGKLGCGPQESFRACSDIAITSRDGGQAPPPAGITSTTTTAGPVLSTMSTAAPTPLTTSRTTIQPSSTTLVPTLPTMEPAVTPHQHFPMSRPTRRPTRRPRPTTGRPTIRTSTTAATITVTVATTAGTTSTTTTTSAPPLIQTTPFPAVTTTRTTTITPTLAAPSGSIIDFGCPSGRYMATAVNSGPGMDIWCTNNCQRGYCPDSFCLCAP